ncbi:hypothetical protein CYMTET_19781 [Cymbomonas tetramitiformis]|uniref:Proteasome maturation factor UMP1 n=1 Tax=Cymbomonas tetramitiformis TaxID=36881 RepID=A0AAE0L4Y1_9CHLO|nr:hypothetical protein CYMTET_19781 [Cymbomonas tetramitiformis]
MDDPQLPFMSTPVDNLRGGLGALKHQVSDVHPVETIQKNGPKSQRELRQQMASNLYGCALPIREDLECQILSKVQRLPGLSSSRIGLESLTGTLDTFGFESYLGLPQFSEEAPDLDLHHSMEARLSMTPGPAPQGRMGR